MMVKSFPNDSTEKDHNNSALLAQDDTICLPSGDTALDCFSGSWAWLHCLSQAFSVPPITDGTHMQDRRHRSGFHSDSQNPTLPYCHYLSNRIPAHAPTFHPHRTTCTPPSAQVLELPVSLPMLCLCLERPSLPLGLSNEHLNAFQVPA